jgi:tetratricopeptide (TPR) repeat protein
MLLDQVRPTRKDKPSPASDAMTRQWYRATAAYMQKTERYDNRHLDRAVALFPRDPDILFLAATEHEAYSGAAIQAALHAAALPTGVTLGVAPRRDELRTAAELFERALAARPGFTEAQLRRGRVLGVLGRHSDAAAELRDARAHLDEPQLRYQAAMFLGAEEEALGHAAGARDLYAEAAALYPRAPSPRLALSALARREGKPADAIGALTDALTRDPADEDDPWWWYYVAQARNADELLDELRAPFLNGWP